MDGSIIWFKCWRSTKSEEGKLFEVWKESVKNMWLHTWWDHIGQPPKVVFFFVIGKYEYTYTPYSIYYNKDLKFGQCTATEEKADKEHFKK